MLRETSSRRVQVAGLCSACGSAQRAAGASAPQACKNQQDAPRLQKPRAWYLHGTLSRVAAPSELHDCVGKLAGATSAHVADAFMNIAMERWLTACVSGPAVEPCILPGDGNAVDAVAWAEEGGLGSTRGSLSCNSLHKNSSCFEH